MPAIPAIISGGAAIGASLIGSKMGKSAADAAMQRTPAEQGAFDANTKLAGGQVQQSNQMFATAMPAVRNSLNYYQTLLGGNRAARMGAVAPEAESVSGAYRGAETALKRNYVQGGQRDMALAENSRARAGDIARLTTGVRPGAAAASAGIAQNLIPAAQRGYGTAAGIYGGQVNNEMQNRQYGDQAGSRTSANFGRLFAQILALTGGRNGGVSGKSSGGPMSFAVPGEDM